MVPHGEWRVNSEKKYHEKVNEANINCSEITYLLWKLEDSDREYEGERMGKNSWKQ